MSHYSTAHKIYSAIITEMRTTQVGSSSKLLERLTHLKVDILSDEHNEELIKFNIIMMSIPITDTTVDLFTRALRNAARRIDGQIDTESPGVRRQYLMAMVEAVSQVSNITTGLHAMGVGVDILNIRDPDSLHRGFTIV